MKFISEKQLGILFCIIFAISVVIYYFVSMTIGGWIAAILIILGSLYMIGQGIRWSWIDMKQLLDQIDSLKK